MKQTIIDGWAWTHFFAARLLEAVFGEVVWTPPDWLRRSLQWVWKKRLPIAGILILAVSTWMGWNWWQNRPRVVPPEALIASITAPAKTDYNRAPPTIQPLRIQFNHPAKPIESGEEAKGFNLSPQFAGRWTWVDETQVVFVPAADWPIGKSYQVRIDIESCCTRMRPFAAGELAFTVEGFTGQLGQAEFYQDPTDPRIKRALFELAFSHPVEPASLEKRLEMALMNIKSEVQEPPAFTVTYAPNRLTARVQSAPLTLPGDGGTVTLNVAPGVQSLLGGAPFGMAFERGLALPARNSLQVQFVDPTVVDNASGTPEQVLILGFNQEVAEQELLGKVKLRLLPRQDPDPDAEVDADDRLWSLDRIPESVMKEAKVLPLSLIAGERDVSMTHGFRLALEPGRQVLVEVAGGLNSFGQFVMPKPYRGLVSAPDFPKLLSFVGEGGLLSLKGERRLSLALRNVPLAQVTVARVRPEELHHLVRFNEGEMVKPSLRGLGRDDLTERFSEVVESPVGRSGSQIHYAGVDLGQYWAPDKKGVFLLSVREITAEERARDDQEYNDPFDQYAYYNDDGNLADRRLVVLSDLGVISKHQKNGERRVFVNNLSSGSPVASAMVSVLGRNGSRVLKAVTNAEGMAILPDLSQLQREREPVLLLVESGDDASFLPLGDYQRQLDFSRFDIGGEATPVDGAVLRAHLFSDRGLYRPGETLHVGAIVRREDWQALPVGAPLELQLTDPRGQLLSTRALSLETHGFHEFSYELAGHAPTGSYTVSLVQWLDAKRTQSRFLGSTNLRVKEFQPDRMKIKSAFSPVRQALWLKPDALRIEVGVEHLFGGAAVGRRVAAKLRLRPVDRVLPGFEDYVFAATDPGFEVQEYTLDEQVTDAQGAVVLDTGLAGIETPHYQLDAMLEAFELEGGRSVPSDLGTRISQADWLVGLKADEQNLTINRGAERALHWIAIDAQGKPVDPPDLRFEIIEQRYVSILTRGDDGLYRYESRLKELPVLAEAIAFQNGKATLKLPTGEPGDFRLRLFDGQQVQLAQVMYSVAGVGNTTRSLERNAELKLKLLDAEPEAGSEIALSLEAPYAGAGLITIERERVLAHVWFVSDSSRSVQKIRLPADLEGHAYVSVQFLRAIDSPEIFMSPLSFASAPFRIRPTARDLSLSIEAAGKHRPGVDLPVTVRTAEPSRIALFAVDEGILQVAGYRLVDPKDRFFAKRQLEVETAQILDLVLPEFSLLTAAAGGDAEAALARHLNPFKRQLDKPAVYWAGLRDVDGSETWSIPIPDSFNGRLKIMAVAVSESRIGIGTADTEVRAPFVLIPSAPAFVSPGDQFELGLSIQREAGQGDRTTRLTVEADRGLQIVGAATQTFELAPGAETSFRLSLKAAQQLGAGRVRMIVESGAQRSERSVEISLRPLMPYRGQQQLGRFDGKQRPITGLRELWPDFAKRELIAGHTPLVMIGGIQANLEDFPHQCSEQLLSQAMGKLLIVRYPEYAHSAIPDQHWQQVFDVLRARTNSEGGLGLWVAGEDADVFASVWAGLFFLEAEEVGVAVPQDLVQRNIEYLRTFDLGQVDHGRFDYWLALYVRARRGEVVTLPMQGLLQSESAELPDGLGSNSLRAALHAIHQDPRAASEAIKPVLKEFQQEFRVVDYRLDGYLNPVLARNLALLVLYRHFPDQVKRLPANAFAHLEIAVQERLLNTVSAGSASLALMAQGKLLGEQVGADDLALHWQDASKKSDRFGVMRQLDVAGAWPASATGLSMTNSGSLPTWFALRESGFEKTLPTLARHAGLELAREYRRTDGKPLDQIDVGDEIEVNLRLRASDLRGGSLAVVELLPAGFELQEYPVDEYAPREARFVSSDQGWMSFLDAREDRLVLYVTGSEQMQTWRYRLKATQRGVFAVPPTYAEDMYDARRSSIGAAGQTLTVE